MLHCCYPYQLLVKQSRYPNTNFGISLGGLSLSHPSPLPPSFSPSLPSLPPFLPPSLSFLALIPPSLPLIPPSLPPSHPSLLSSLPPSPLPPSLHPSLALIPPPSPLTHSKHRCPIILFLELCTPLSVNSDLVVSLWLIHISGVREL